MYDSLPARQTPVSPRLRRAYGMRLVKEPILDRSKVPHRTALRSPRDVFAFMQPFAAQEPAETFWGIPLDAQHRCVAPVVITRGRRGMAIFQPKTKAVFMPAHGSDEVSDVTGAGDTVVATFTLALSAGADVTAAARLANIAAGVSVMKAGAATVSPDELRRAIQRG